MLRAVTHVPMELRGGFSTGGTAVHMPVVAPCRTWLLLQPWVAVPNFGLTAQAAAESREDLYRKCRQEAFRRYGQPGAQYNRRPNQKVLPSQFVIATTDQCVANGGRYN